MDVVSGAGQVLSGREADVIVLAAAGCTNGQIARKLGLSVKTVAAHFTRAFAKTRTRDRAEIVAWCYWRGVLDGTTWPATLRMDEGVGEDACPLGNYVEAHIATGVKAVDGSRWHGDESSS